MAAQGHDEVRFDDKPIGDRIQMYINRGVPGLFWTSYLSLQPLLNILLFDIRVTLNGRVMLHNLQACAPRFERTLHSR